MQSCGGKFFPKTVLRFTELLESTTILRNARMLPIVMQKIAHRQRQIKLSTKATELSMCVRISQGSCATGGLLVLDSVPKECPCKPESLEHRLSNTTHRLPFAKAPSKINRAFMSAIQCSNDVNLSRQCLVRHPRALPSTPAAIALWLEELVGANSLRTKRSPCNE